MERVALLRQATEAPEGTKTRLAQLEEIIEEAGRRAYIDRGRALKEIRGSGPYKHRPYRHAGYNTFEEYCTERWGFAKDTVNRWISAYEVSEILMTIVSKIPSSESVARPLTEIRTDDGEYDESAIIEVWQRCLELREDQPLRAEDVEKVKDELFEQDDDDDDQPDDDDDKVRRLRKLIKELLELRDGFQDSDLANHFRKDGDWYFLVDEHNLPKLKMLPIFFENLISELRVIYDYRDHV